MSASRLWLPTLLGVIAAAGNYVLVTKHTTTHEVVAVRGDVKAGAPLVAADLTPVAVRGDVALYAGTVAYADRHAVIGLTPRRPLREGELVLRADVEHEANQFVEPPPGYVSLTLAARPAAVVARPPAGAHVQLHVRAVPGAHGPATVVYGPYQFLGWVAPPPQSREVDLIHVAVAVPQTAGIKEHELRVVQEAGSVDRLVQVEVVGRPRN